MVRALNELHPHTILDLGLGISSTLISSYMSHFNYEDGVHDIVEENLDWIDFYRNRHKMSLNSEIFHKKVIERKNNDFNRSDHSRTDEWGGGGRRTKILAVLSKVKNMTLFLSMGRVAVKE